ncbi:MAG: hypothetical protein ACK568_19350, partial [Pseudanabaena sp.]
NKGDRCPVRKNFSDRHYLSLFRNTNIMAAKAVKHAVETTTQPELATPDAIAFDLEEQIADELLNNIDWAKVRSTLLKKAPAKLFAWLVSGNNPPVNISPFPELAALESAE